MPDAPEPEPGHEVPVAPTGWSRLLWLGPGFLWMVSAAGSGELLFTPRVGALYGYALLWAMLAAVTLKWFINREVGRYTVVTGRTILEGFERLPGPQGWALWVILVPQVLVAVATIAGLAGSAATALILVLPGDVRWWTLASIGASTALVAWGRYKGVERVATAIALALAVAAVVAALTVGPSWSALGAGVAPQVPEDVDYGEVLPWLGFMLSGAAGMVWYSYWLRAKGYGRAGMRDPEDEPGEAPDAPEAEEDRKRVRAWIWQLTLDNSVAVVGTLVLTLAFLILGVELLRPEGLVPEEDRVAEVLGRLLGGVWGQVGFWFMVLGVYVGFWSTVLSDQDGFARMFANGTRRLLPRRIRRGRWMRDLTLRRAYVAVLLTLIPIALYLARGEPVGLLKAAGAIEAAHIPILAALTLYLNLSTMPKGIRPSLATTLATGFAALFFAGFALLYLGSLFGWGP